MSYRHLVRFISRLMAGVQSIINSGYICDASKRELLCFSLCAAQMFRIASGDPWPGSLPILNEDGSMEYSTCLYMCTFIVIVCWVRDPHRGETRAATTGLAAAATVTRIVELGCCRLLLSLLPLQEIMVKSKLRAAAESADRLYRANNARSVQ